VAPPIVSFHYVAYTARHRLCLVSLRFTLVLKGATCRCPESSALLSELLCTDSVERRRDPPPPGPARTHLDQQPGSLDSLGAQIRHGDHRPAARALPGEGMPSRSCVSGSGRTVPAGVAWPQRSDRCQSASSSRCSERGRCAISPWIARCSRWALQSAMHGREHARPAPRSGCEGPSERDRFGLGRSVITISPPSRGTTVCDRELKDVAGTEKLEHVAVAQHHLAAPQTVHDQQPEQVVSLPGAHRDPLRSPAALAALSLNPPSSCVSWGYFGYCGQFEACGAERRGPVPVGAVTPARTRRRRTPRRVPPRPSRRCGLAAGVDAGDDVVAAAAGREGSYWW